MEPANIKGTLRRSECPACSLWATNAQESYKCGLAQKSKAYLEQCKVSSADLCGYSIRGSRV